MALCGLVTSTMIAPISAPRTDIEIWDVLQRHRKLIVCMAILGVLAGVAYVAQSTSIYESSAQILIIKKQTGINSNADSNYEDLVTDDVLATQIMIIQSPLVVKRAVEDHGLSQLASFRGLGDPTWMITSGLSVAKGSRAAREANVLTVSYTGSDPRDCSKVLAAVINSYRDFLNETYRNVSAETIGLISTAKDDLEKQLISKEAAYLEFRKSSPFHWADGATGSPNIHERRLTQLEDARQTMQKRERELTAHLAALQEAIKRGDNEQSLVLLIQRMSDVSAANRSNITQQFQTVLFQQQAELRVLMDDYGADHYLVRQQQKRLEALKGFLNEWDSPGKNDEDLTPGSSRYLPTYVESRQQELKELAELRRGIDAEFVNERESAQSAMIYKIRDDALQADISRTQRIFDRTLETLQELNLVKNYGGYKTRTISPPSFGRNTSRQPIYILAFAAAFGACLGIGLAYVFQLNDRSFHSMGDIQSETGLPVIGHLPLLTRTQAMFKPNAKSPNGLPSALFAIQRPNSPEAEACRSIRTSLLFSAQTPGGKVVQVTSPDVNDGKTLVSLNLAAIMAMPGKRVLLIDANFRNPQLHQVFGIPEALTLVDAVGLETEQWTSKLTQGPIDNFWLLPAGVAQRNPAELLSSSEFEEFLQQARQEFDFVILDSPSVLSVTDATILAQRADGVVMTMRFTRDGRPRAIQATELLNKVEANLLGTVVNAVGPAALQRSVNSSVSVNVPVLANR